MARKNKKADVRDSIEVGIQLLEDELQAVRDELDYYEPPIRMTKAASKLLKALADANQKIVAAHGEGNMLGFEKSEATRQRESEVRGNSDEPKPA